MRIAWRTHSSLMTGSIPGMAASTRLTLAFGASPKPTAAPEKSLALEATCAWISRPITTSQSPVAPGMRFFGLAWAVMAGAIPTVSVKRTG